MKFGSAADVRDCGRFFRAASNLCVTFFFQSLFVVSAAAAAAIEVFSFHFLRDSGICVWFIDFWASVPGPSGDTLGTPFFDNA
jgi:hypothetical protein